MGFAQLTFGLHNRYGVTHMTYEQNSQRDQDGSFSRFRDSERAGDNKSTADEVRRRAHEAVDNTRERTASGIDSIVGAATAAAEDLREHNQEGLSRYVSEIADSVSSVANSLRHKSVDELIHEASAIARRNPTLFLAGSLAIGLGIGRFARSSAKYHHSEPDTEMDVKKFDAQSFDKDYPHNVSGDAYPERAEVGDIQHVTEEDYLADDFALAGGEEIDLEIDGLGGSDSRLDERREPNSDLTAKRTPRDFTAANKNQPIGGDFYE